MQSMAEHYFQQGIEQGTHQTSIETTLNILTERFSNVDADALRKHGLKRLRTSTGSSS